MVLYMQLRKMILRILPVIAFLCLAGLKLLPRIRGLGVADILEFTPSSPVLAAAVLLGLYCLKAFTLVIPLLVLYLSAAVMFPLGWALVITYLCLTAEMTISYFIGRRFGQKGILAKLEKYQQAKQILDFGKDNDSGIIKSLMVRLIPGLPVELGSMFLGATNVRYLPYLIGTLLGVSRGAIPIILMGSAVNNPLSPAFLVPFFITVVLSLITFLFTRRKAKDKNRSPK